MAAKAENGDVGVVDYTAYLPPPPPPSESSEKLVTPAATGGVASAEMTPAQVAMHKKVLEHFQSESYKIPNLKDGELLEVEKFWLVRVLFLLFFVEGYVLGVNFYCLQSNDCMLR